MHLWTRCGLLPLAVAMLALSMMVPMTLAMPCSASDRASPTGTALPVCRVLPTLQAENV